MLPTIGLISMKDIATELKLTPASLLSLNDSRVRSLAKKPTGSIGFQDLLGKSTSLEFTMLQGASAAQTLMSNPDAGTNACFSKGFYFTTSDDSEITFIDLVTKFHNGVYPNYGPISDVGTSGSRPGSRYLDASSNKAPLTPNIFYPLGQAKYTTEFVQYSVKGARDKVPNPFTYYPTGNILEYNYLEFLIVFDNLSKVNANMSFVSETGVGGTSTLNIAAVKADAKKVTDKINVGALIVCSMNMTPDTNTRSYGTTIDRSTIKSAITGAYAEAGTLLLDDNVNKLFNARL